MKIEWKPIKELDLHGTKEVIVKFPYGLGYVVATESVVKQTVNPKDVTWTYYTEEKYRYLRSPWYIKIIAKAYILGVIQLQKLKLKTILNNCLVLIRRVKIFLGKESH